MQEKDECEKEIHDLNSTLSQKVLKLDRFELILSDNEPGTDQDELYISTRSLKMEIEEILDRIDDLQSKVDRKTDLIIGYSSVLSNSKIEEIKSRALTVSTLQDSQNLVTVLFEGILEKASEIKKLDKIIMIKNAEISNKQSEISEGELRMEMVIKNYNSEIFKLKNEFKLKECMILEELNSIKNIDQVTSFQEPEDLSRDTENDLLKEPKSARNLCENKTPDKDKSRNRGGTFVSLTKARESYKKKKTTPEEESKIRKSPLTARALTSKLPDDDPPSLSKSSASKSRTPIDSESQRNLQKWKLQSSTDTHKGSIYSMVTQENILYTASNQTIKVWSLDTLTHISELNAHTSAIKSMAISPENSIIFSSCGNLVKIWDTVSLQTVGSLQVNLEEIRSLKLCSHLLYTAGKSNENGNSIFIWDLRKSQSPVYESEKNQNVFGVDISEQYLFYARKNNTVCQCMVSKNDVKVYEPAHTNIVSGVAVYRNSVISVSRDRCVKQWEINSGKCLRSLPGAHSDWINCVQQDHLERQVYTAGKEGKIKVWRGDNLKIVGELLGMNTNILCISSLIVEDVMIVSAGTDKTFKIWKMLEDVY